MSVTATHPADTRIAAFGARFGGPFGATFTLLIAVAIAIFVATTSRLYPSAGCSEILVDFCVFWSASKLALGGQVAAVFNPELVAQAGSFAGADWSPWLHPAATLLALLPFGLFSMPVAWAIFSALSLAAVIAAVRLFTRPNARVWLGFALAPALMPALFTGQLTILWIAGLVWALWCLQQRKCFTAGVAIGLLTLKPTLGLMIPVALLAAREWKVIAVATATTITINLIASLAFGFSYWSALIELYGQHKTFLFENVDKIDAMASVAALGARAGLSVADAVTLQAAITFAIMIWLFWVWRRQQISFDLKAAALAAAIPLSTPYLWYYDAAMVLVSGLFLLRAGAIPVTTGGLVALLTLCFGPGLTIIAAMIAPQSQLSVAWICVPVMLLAFILCLRPAHRTPHKPLERTR